MAVTGGAKIQRIPALKLLNGVRNYDFAGELKASATTPAA
jgi:hypothetical protein